MNWINDGDIKRLLAWAESKHNTFQFPKIDEATDSYYHEFGNTDNVVEYAITCINDITDSLDAMWSKEAFMLGVSKVCAVATMKRDPGQKSIASIEVEAIPDFVYVF